MKILFLTHNIQNDNGGGVCANKFIACAREVGDVSVCALLPSDGVSVFLDLKWSRLLSTLLKVRKEIKSADVVHALDVFPFGLVAFIAGIGLKKPLIVTAVGSGTLVALNRPFLAPILRYVLRSARRVTAISTYVGKALKAKVLDINPEIQTLGVDSSWWAVPTPITRKLESEYIVSVGALRWRKGYKYSLPAFKKIADKFPNLHYYIIGKRYSDKQFNKINNLIKELDLSGRAHILEDVKTREELRGIYQKAKLFFLMSQNKGDDVEGFGLVFLEAASAGLPVVGSNGGGVPDAVKDGVNGILVPETDVGEASEALYRILSDGALLGKMRQASFYFARSSDWEYRIAPYRAMYQSFVR